MENIEVKDITAVPDGLTAEAVAALKAEGKVNKSDEKAGKSYFQIIKDNLFTFFNLVYAIVTLLLIICGEFDNLTFLAVIIPNLLISTFQEIKAKRTVEKLAVTTEPKATVIRDGVPVVISAEEIVLGDVMLIEMGKQVLSDAIVISGFAEANESMLTGESDAIKKQSGDKVLAGSFLVGGSIYAKVINVGKDNYVHKIEKAAKSFKAPSSNLFRDLTKLIKTIGIFIVPMSAVLFVSNWLSYDKDIITAISKTCGAVIGMIPAGIYLLVTLTLTLSVIKLSKKDTLVQDMYSIEMLASADVLCLDKTGTITDGTMQVTDVIPLGAELSEIERIMSSLEGTEQSINNTSAALIERFGRDSSVKIIEKIPFSSARKFSAASIEGVGAFSIGAPHFVPCPVSTESEDMIKGFALEGKRVLLLSRHERLEDEGEPIALIAISDRIRIGAAETIAKFQEQGVTLKVISGDHAATVSTIASRVGIKNADKYISCEALSDEEIVEAAENYAVFGRVTPEQKVLLIKTLKVNGHTVAMTGDGVNDTLALKESNCAIAMADGSEMACKVSQIVLMNSDFTTLPDVVREGRRCINNVRQSSVLFLMKTLFTIILSIFSVVSFQGYPFSTKQFTLLELLIIGLASVMLALEPNNKRIEGSYLDKVIIRSVPNAICMLLPVFAIMIGANFSSIANDNEARNAMAAAIVTLVGYINLFALCRPFTKWRVATALTIAALLATTIPVSIFLLNDILGFKPIAKAPLLFLIMVATSTVFAVIMHFFREKFEGAIEKTLNDSREKERQRVASGEKKASLFAFLKKK